MYLNPGDEGFRTALRSKIYVDKTGLIGYTNGVLGTNQKYVCVSRPRRFGKTMAANMLAAYYDRQIDSVALFQDLEIGRDPSFQTHINRYHVIFLNMQEFLSRSHDVSTMKEQLTKYVLLELLRAFPDLDYLEKNNLVMVLQDIYRSYKVPFVFIIDEWDCIFREKKRDLDAQTKYLDFLRDLLKDKAYVGLAYMTGILPIKKYGTHSALNMFDEFSMTDASFLAQYAGFTEAEVRDLCERFDVDFQETKRWYDGYLLGKGLPVYSPKSVVDVMLRKKFGSYWTHTETYEALKVYMVMNFDGLKDAVVRMLAGGRCKINPRTFQNDMTSFQEKDDVLTLLVHLGYLAYDSDRKEVFVPNLEIETEFKNAIDGAGWNEVIKTIDSSNTLLEATWAGDAQAVAAGIDEAHMDTASILAYNDENALSCVISLAYYSAKEYYTLIREFPSGKGFADLVFLPRQNHMDKPALVVELKWDKSAEGAISQIKEKQYGKALQGYSGEILLVGINYDKGSKVHQCMIEKVGIV